MSLISLLVVLVVIGVVIWAVTTYIPMNLQIRNLIIIVGVIVAVVYVLNAFGIIGRFVNVQVPTLK